MTQDEKITIQPKNQEAPAKENELPEKELEKVSGGLRAAPTVVNTNAGEKVS